MRKKLAPVLESPAQEQEERLPDCQHYWVIDSPHGPESRGVCRKCGDQKAFLNTFRSYYWEEDFQGEARRRAAASDQG